MLFKNSKFNQIILFLLLVFFISIKFFSNNSKLEKPDEYFAFYNIYDLHDTGSTDIEKFTENKILLNFFSSNNFFKINYFFLKCHDWYLSKLKNFFNFEYNVLTFNKLDFIDEQYNHENRLTHEKFYFGKNKLVFNHDKFDILDHYNILYFNNFIIFLFFFVTYVMIFNYFKLNIYPLLVYFLTPQVNNLILFINSDFLIIIITPLIYILLLKKKFFLTFIIIFLLQTLNRSTLILWTAYFFYLFFILTKDLGIKKNLLLIITFLTSILAILFYKYLFLNLITENYRNLFSQNLFSLLENGEINILFFELINSFSIFLVSTLYLGGLNSFILNIYDYLIFLILCICLFFYLIKYKFENYLSFFIFFISAFIFIFFLNNFDHFRHHPLVYFSFIFVVFSTNLNLKYFNYIKSFFLIFLFYANIKSIYVEQLVSIN